MRGPSATRPVAQPMEPCPLTLRRLTGRFVPPRAKCGDGINLQADGVLIPDDTPTNFAIVDHQNGTGVDAVSRMMRGGRVRDAAWVTKKEDDTWDEPHLSFNVSAAGLLARSSNQFTFHRYPNFARAPVTSAMSGTSRTSRQRFDWTSKYDIEFTDRVVIISTKIKLVNRQGRQPARARDPLPAAGPAVDDALKRQMKAGIEGYLSEKWVLHRHDCLRHATCDCPRTRKCCKFRVVIRVDFVESGEYHTVNLFQGRNRTVDTESWGRVPWHRMNYAHEVGHLLGFYDEYPEGANGPAPWRSSRRGALMYYSTAQSTAVPEHYYHGFRSQFQSRAGETWDLVSP